MENKETLEEAKDLAYYKTNAEEDYLQVPISVLRYISQLEQEQDKKLYSEQELINISIQYFNHYYNISSRGRLIIDHDLEWFEQFSKLKL
jgi:hypothetical protein